MSTNNNSNMLQPGLQVFSTNAIIGRSIGGTSNQIAVTNGDGTGGDPTVGFDTYRVLSTQPCFLAKVSGTLSNVTGDGTSYIIPFDNEIFDQGSNYNPATGVFTAPVTGKYYFYSVVTLSGLLVTHTTIILYQNASSGLYWVRPGKLFTILDSNGLITIQGGMTINLSVGGTFSSALQINGGTKVVDIYGNNDSSWLCGYLCL